MAVSSSARAPLERLEVDLPVLVVLDEHQLAPGAPLQLQERDGVGAVLGPSDQHPVVRLEGQRVHRHVPRPAGRVEQRDLLGRRADQLGEGRVRALQGVGRLGGRLVAARARFELEVADHGVEHGLGEQRSAGVVEVEHLVTPGREGARPLDVDGSPAGGYGI